MNYYNDHFGVMFGNSAGSYHTFRDWGLYPVSVSIANAEPKLEQTPIPGTNGVLDRSEALTGFLTYKNRAATLTYKVGNRASWETIHTKIKTILDGRETRIIRDEEPAYYYRGRVWVKDLKKQSDAAGLITITADLEPYKYEINGTVTPWLWDSFSFVTGEIRTIYDGIKYRDVDVRGTDTVLDPDNQPVYLLEDVPYNAGGGEALILNNETKEITILSSPAGGSPVVEYTGDMFITIQGVSVHLLAETETRLELIDIELPHKIEEVPVTITGTGTIWVDYTAGYL